MTKDLSKAIEADEGASQLLHSLRDLIQNARQRALRAVDVVQVQTCWEIGRHIVEFEQGGSTRADMEPGCCRLWLRPCLGVRERVRRLEPPIYAAVLQRLSNS